MGGGGGQIDDDNPPPFTKLEDCLAPHAFRITLREGQSWLGCWCDPWSSLAMGKQTVMADV